MNSLNRAEIIGNVTREPELKSTRAGQHVTTIGVATNRRWKDNTGQNHDEAEYHNIVCWGRLAEIACQYLQKGSKVFFSGRLQTRSWEDDAGMKHFRTEVVAEDMIMLAPPMGGRAGGSSAPRAAAAPSAAPAAPAAPMAEPTDLDEDDLPF